MIVSMMRPTGAAHEPRTASAPRLERRRRLTLLRRLSLALCCAGIALCLGLLALPEARVSVPAPKNDIPAGSAIAPSRLTTVAIPSSLAQSFLASSSQAEGCHAQIRLAARSPIPRSACSRVPPLEAGQTLVLVPTSVPPDALRAGSPAEAWDGRRGSRPVSVIVWGFETGSDGTRRARLAVRNAQAPALVEAASRGEILLSPAS